MPLKDHNRETSTPPAAGQGHYAAKRKQKRTKAKAHAKMMAWHKVNTQGWIPDAREGHAAHVVNGTMFVFGGIANGQRVNSTVCLDLAPPAAGGTGGGAPGRRWRELTTVGEPPVPRSYFGSWCEGSLIFVHGGEGDALEGGVAPDADSPPDGDVPQPKQMRLCLDDLYVLDVGVKPARWKHVRTRLQPLPRRGHSVIRARLRGDDSILLFGGGGAGRLHAFDLYFAPHDVLLEGRSIWNKAKTMGQIPLPRQGHSTTVGPPGSDRVFVFGGITDDGVLLDDLHVLNTEALTWSAPAVRGRPPSPRHGHGAILRINPAAKISETNDTRNDGASVDSRSGAALTLLVYGGVSVHLGAFRYPTDVHVCRVPHEHGGAKGDTVFLWSQVQLGYGFPAPRFAHSMAAVHSSGIALLREAGGSAEQQQTGACGVSQQSTNAVQGTPSARAHADDGRAFAGPDILVFGGLNSTYCASDTWCLDTTLRPARLGHEAEPSIQDAAKGKTGAAAELAMAEVAVARARRDAQMMEKQLLAERIRRQQVEQEHEALQKLQRETALQLETEKQRASTESWELQQALDEQVRECGRIDAAYQETCALVGLVDMAAALRVSVWKERAGQASMCASASSASVPSATHLQGSNSSTTRSLPAMSAVADEPCVTSSAETKDEVAAQIMKQAATERSETLALADTIDDERFRMRARASPMHTVNLGAPDAEMRQ